MVAIILSCTPLFHIFAIIKILLFKAKVFQFASISKLNSQYLSKLSTHWLYSITQPTRFPKRSQYFQNFNFEIYLFIFKSSFSKLHFKFFKLFHKIPRIHQVLVLRSKTLQYVESPCFANVWFPIAAVQRHLRSTTRRRRTTLEYIPSQYFAVVTSIFAVTSENSETCALLRSVVDLTQLQIYYPYWKFAHVRSYMHELCANNFPTEFQGSFVL